MYTSEPVHKKVWVKSEGSPDAMSSSSSVHLTPLRKSEKPGAAAFGSAPVAAATHTSPARSSPLPTRSPLPPTWASSPSLDLEETSYGRAHRTTVMDPLAALRQCLQYVCSHPEVYGDDVRGLLDREVMHVVRLKASEVALTQGQRPLLVDPLDSLSLRPSARTFSSRAALPSISSNSTAAPLRSQMMASTKNHTMSTIANTVGGEEWAAAGNLFGYGAVSFLPANSTGFAALLRDTRTTKNVTGSVKGFGGTDGREGTLQTPLVVATVEARQQQQQQQQSLQQPLDEPIQWNDTLPPSPLSGAGANARSIADRLEGGAKGGAHSNSSLPDSLLGGPCNATNAMQRSEDARLFRQVDEAAPSLFLPASRGTLCAANGSAIVLDHHGYEVTYLRAQLQQLEAAFNTKCVRLHELESESKLFAKQMKASEEAAARWSAENHVMEGKLEALRRELDGWKDRANDALAAATKQSKERSQHAKQLASNQISDAKQEAARLSRLWRETERALQESRRAFENTKKEAAAAHSHLSDAFHYLERLERRVARRDAYVQLSERRHRSLEEKYEKLMWGYEELSVVEGRYSYVDYLLTSRPLWSVYLFLALAQHRGDYVAVEDHEELRRRSSLMAAPFSEGGATPAGSEGHPEVADLHGWLLFARTPRGGCYAGACFDPTLVLRCVVNEVTAQCMRRGRAKQLHTNLHGSVACRAIRWGERFCIDYLGGQNSFPDSGELNRKCVPILTLASVLMPLRARSGAFQQVEGSAAATGTAAPIAVSNSAAPSLISPIANTKRYDAATLRFVLRCFWKERLQAFTAQMTSRVEAAQARRQRLERHQAERWCNSNSVSGVQSSNIVVSSSPPYPRGKANGDRQHVIKNTTELVDEEEEEEEEQAEGGPAVATFLSALVDFAVRFTKLPGGAAAASSGPPGAGNTADPSSTLSPSLPDKCTLLRVRGVLARDMSAKGWKSGGYGAAASSSSDAKLWNCGRVFFATILQSRPSTGKAAGAAATNPSKSMLSDGADDVEVAALADDVRELLAALYYYALEYHTQEPDFRLFYLVSHQLIPEMVGVNFFASLEAMQRDCAALLEKRLRVVAEGKGREVFEEPPVEPTDVAEAFDDPLTALTRVVQLVDDVPLDSQDGEIEPDSDGEGYGSIIPFHAKAGSYEAAPVTNLSAPPTEEEPAERSSRSSNALSRKASGSMSRAAVRHAKELELLHNIRSYLKETHGSMQEEGGEGEGSTPGDGEAGIAGVEGGPGAASRFSDFALGDAPRRWMALEEEVLHRLAPHTALLDAFRGHRGPRAVNVPTGSFASAVSRSNVIAPSGTSTNAGGGGAGAAGRADRGYLRRKRANRRVRHELTKCLSATRGLLTAEDVLSLLTRHCFATYAVACCGTPRFSLTDALIKRSSVDVERGGYVPMSADALQPYAVVGHLPPTGLHLQRLRFALSLDQPSSLVNPTELFTVDAVTKSNNHLYSTFLTLALDLFQQQQSFLMQSVLSGCVKRHEKYAAEGAEDCDGNIPIASLRKSMTTVMTAIQGGAQHATALVNHFVQYDELLRLEDEVKLEQFADAPLLLNLPPPAPRPPTGLGAFRSAGNLKAAASFKGNFQTNASFARRQSEANSVMEEVEDAGFNLHEEAESCSLLHIAFAIRMSYVVWGRLSTETAAALVSRVVQRVVPTRRCHPDDVSGATAADAPGVIASPSASNFGSSGASAARDGIRVTEQPEWEVFEQEVHQKYTRALTRLQEGHNGDDNPLRQTLRDDYFSEPGYATVIPYRSAEAAMRGVARAAAAAATADHPVLYPDIRRVFGISDATSAVSSETGAPGSRRVPNVDKKKKPERTSTALQLTPPLPKSSSSGQLSVQPPSISAALTPDYDLISFSRALGFVSPVTAAAPSGAGGLASSSKKSAAAKKAPKKAVVKKAAGAEAATVSTAAQEEYSRALSRQLQGLAARLARLFQPAALEHSGRGEEQGEQGEAAESLPRPQRSEEVSEAGGAEASSAEHIRGATFPDAETDTSALPPRSSTRTRSVAFVQGARGLGLSPGEARRSVGPSSDEADRTAAAAFGRSGTWRPVFAQEAREVEEMADAADAAGSVLDVSRLYAACAALSIL